MDTYVYVDISAYGYSNIHSEPISLYVISFFMLCFSA